MEHTENDNKKTAGAPYALNVGLDGAPAKYMVVLYKKEGSFYRRIGECPSSDKGVAYWPMHERKHQAAMDLLRDRIRELEEKYEPIPETERHGVWPFP